MEDVMAPPTPDASQLPAAGGVNPGAPQVTPPNPNPSADQHHSWLGRGIRHIASALEGQQVSYEPDPTTGEAKEVVTPRKPGGVFRDMILGAIAGGAAGGTGKGQQPNGAAGFFQGFQGAHKSQQDQQDKAQADAQGLAQRQKAQADQKAVQDKADQQTAAGIATNFVSDLNYGKNIDIHDHASVQRHNISGDIVSSEAKKLGGVEPVIPDANGRDINGKSGNGPELMKMFNSDPTIMQAPEGFHRVPVFHFDTTGMDHEEGKGYSQDGKDVDPNDHVSVSFIDVPTTAWGKNVTLTKGNVNDVAGSQIAQGKDSDSVTTSFGSLFSLKLKNAKDLNAQHADLISGPKNDDDAEAMAGKIAAINADPNSSPAEKRWAKVKTNILDVRNKAKDDRLEKEAAAKKEGKEDDFPILKEGDVSGYMANAQRVMQDPASTPEQKATAQKQFQYGRAAAKTLQNTAVNMAAAKKAAEVAAENSQIDKNSKGATNLPPAVQKRFQELPPTVQTQLGDKKTSDIAAVFAMADGDATQSTFPNRVYKGSNQLTQSEAVGLVKQINPDWDPKLFVAKQRLVNNYTDSKKEGGQIQTFNNFLNHAKDASDVVQGFRTTKVPLLNTAMNKMRDQVGGDAAYTQLEAALEPVRKEYMSFLNANRAEHTEDLKVMEKILSDAASPAQIQEGLKQLANTAVLRLDSLNEGWKTVTKGNYPNLVTPSGKLAAEKLGLGNKVAQYGSGGTLTAASTRQNPESGQQQQSSPSPQTHLFDSAVWAKANPKGDVEAAKKYAASQGFTVK